MPESEAIVTSTEPPIESPTDFLSESLVANASPNTANPDYAGLVRFLITPFLESPDALRVDCEVSPVRGKVWVRLAFEASDKGRVFGRGGRNIHSIRAVLSAAAQLSGYTAHLDVFGASPEGEGGYESSRSAPRSGGDRPRAASERSPRREGSRGGDSSRDPSQPPEAGSSKPRPIPKGAASAAHRVAAAAPASGPDPQPVLEQKLDLEQKLESTSPSE